MADKKVLQVMPVQGKYCELLLDNKVYKIWKVHPNTPDKYGTPIPYDIGVYFLGKVPPVITLVPSVERGKFTSQLTKEDQEIIAENVSRGFTGSLTNYNEKSTVSVDTSDPEALKKAVALLQEQMDKNANLQKQIEDLTSKFTELEAGLVVTDPNAAGAVV